ncbi:MAG TPA: hypothetical protein VI356_21280 [Myxococcales bacterium]
MSVDFSRLKRDTLEEPAASTPEQRSAAASGSGLPEPIAGYVRKVHEAAWKVTDEDVGALLAGGLSEDQVYELTLSAALGAGLARFEAGMRALRGGG